jgi:GTP-binding protein HflX
MERLKRVMLESVQALYQEVELFFPKADEHRIYELGRETQITKRETASSGTVCTAHMTPSLLSRWKDFLITADMG